MRRLAPHPAAQDRKSKLGDERVCEGAGEGNGPAGSGLLSQAPASSPSSGLSELEGGGE